MKDDGGSPWRLTIQRRTIHQLPRLLPRRLVHLSPPAIATMQAARAALRQKYAGANMPGHSASGYDGSVPDRQRPSAVEEI